MIVTASGAIKLCRAITEGFCSDLGRLPKEKNSSFHFTHIILSMLTSKENPILKEKKFFFLLLTLGYFATD